MVGESPARKSVSEIIERDKIRHTNNLQLITDN